MYVQISKSPVKRGTKREQLEEIWKDLLPEFRSVPGFHVLYPITDNNVHVAGAITLWDTKDHADAGRQVEQRAIEAFADFYDGDVSVEGYQAAILT